MEKVRMVRALREKETEIGHLQQQMQQLEVVVEAKENQLQQQGTQLRERNTQLQRQGTQLQERDAQINRQQRELDILRVRNARQAYCMCCSCDVTSHVRRTRGGYRWRWRIRTPNSEREMLNFSDRKQNSKKRTCSSADNRESYKY